MLVAARTLQYGKIAETIPFSAFMNGGSNDIDWSFSGLDIKSSTTMRKILDELVADDFLHRYHTEQEEGNARKVYTIYEINFKKIQNLMHSIKHVAGEIMAILREPRAKKPSVGGETEVRLPKIGTRLGAPNDYQKLVDINSINKCDKSHNRITKVIPSGGASLANMIPGIRSKVGAGLQSIAKTTNEVVATAIAKGAERRQIKEAKAAAKASGKITMVRLQAMIDSHMATYNPNLPRVLVSQIPFGKLRTRLAEQGLHDPEPFIEYTIRSWTTLVNSRKRSANRQGKAGMGKEMAQMPSAPDFQTLAYCMPWFLACYRNHLADGSGLGTKEDRIAAENKKLRELNERLAAENSAQRRASAKAINEAKAKANQTQGENLALIRAARRAGVEAPAVVTPVSRFSRRAVVPQRTDEDALPTWEEIQSGRGTK